jgi:hypothetical protein
MENEECHVDDLSCFDDDDDYNNNNNNNNFYIYKRRRILQIHLNLIDSISLFLIIIHIDNNYTI